MMSMAKDMEILNVEPEKAPRPAVIGKILEAVEKVLWEPMQERFTRSFRLGGEYTEKTVRGRIGRMAVKTKAKVKRKMPPGNVNLLVDIQAKM